MFNVAPRLILALSCLLAASCAGSQERLARQKLTKKTESPMRPPPLRQGPDSNSASSSSKTSREPLSSELSLTSQSTAPECSGLSRLVAHALRENPQLASEFENYRAEVHAISAQRRLPNPVLSFGYYLRSVETRVGPQRARLGLSFSFPWPSKLIAGTDAASARARSAEKRFDALALNVAENVQTAYWRLWQIRAARVLHKEHLTIIESLAESALARVATSQSSLADQQQVKLSAARLEDQILTMVQEERSEEAILRAAAGLAPDTPLKTCTLPGQAQPPAESEGELRKSLAQHPLVDALEERALAEEATVRMKKADRLPSFMVGADWIITGDATGANPPDSGKDLKQAQLDRAAAALTAAYVRTVDEARRIHLHERTLIPQADAAYESVIGAYTTGEATIAQTLLAQRDVLELHVQIIEARARHASAWAQLENIVGREVLPSRAALNQQKAKP